MHVRPHEHRDVECHVVDPYANDNSHSHSDFECRSAHLLQTKKSVQQLYDSKFSRLETSIYALPRNVATKCDKNLSVYPYITVVICVETKHLRHFRTNIQGGPKSHILLQHIEEIAYRPIGLIIHPLVYHKSLCQNGKS